MDELEPLPPVIAFDGPQILDWERAASGLASAIAERGVPVRLHDLGRDFAKWHTIQTRTASPELANDPDFGTLADGSLEVLFDRVPRPGPSADGIIIVYGPGAALATDGPVIYGDLPKRYAEAAVRGGKGRNLGQPDGAGEATTRRLFYTDWPLLDYHRDSITHRIIRFIDLQEPTRPTSIGGDALRSTFRELASRPFRTRPTFGPAPWGGHWGQRFLGRDRAARNTALGYELIAPEAGILLGERGSDMVEVPFQMMVAFLPLEVLGERVHEAFGVSFPIRFDYLDTVGGGHLSVHCHPQAEYMSRVFGWRYTQHETYYLMVAGPHSKVFLGLQAGIDAGDFRSRSEEADSSGVPFDIEQFVQSHHAVAHQLYAIPAGTPHGSGEGNVVLEVSATPYLYSLRFYDWLRRDADGTQRPVHVGHAFANLDIRRQGDAVRDELIQTPQRVETGSYGYEEIVGQHPEFFFEVRRLVLETDESALQDARDSFHVLNVVDGDGVTVESATGSHELHYAETMLVPSGVGRYSVTRHGSERVRVVKASIR